MLIARPSSWLSWHYEISDEGKVVASLHLEWMQERATLVIGDRKWQLAREGWYSGDFFLRNEHGISAKAKKPSALHRSFDVTIDHEKYKWAAQSAFTRTFVLTHQSKTIGTMRPTNVFTRVSEIELPETLALEHKAFLIWLAILLWRRQQRSS